MNFMDIQSAEMKENVDINLLHLTENKKSSQSKTKRELFK